MDCFNTLYFFNKPFDFSGCNEYADDDLKRAIYLRRLTLCNDILGISNMPYNIDLTLDNGDILINPTLSVL